MSYYQQSPYRRTIQYSPKRSRRLSAFPSFLLFYVLPFFVFNGILFFCVTAKPKITVSVADTNDYQSTEVSVTVNSWFPTRSLTVSIDNEPLNLTKQKNRTYTATVYKNGSIEATAVNINGMPTTVFEHVNVLDDTLPSIESTDTVDGVITLTISDSQSGINFDSIYALDAEGQRVEPLTVDRATNTLSFYMGPDGLEVYAQDNAGNEVHQTFTYRKEGGSDTQTTAQ